MGGFCKTIFSQILNRNTWCQGQCLRPTTSNNCNSASTPQSGTSHKTCLRGFGGNGSIAWTSAVPHEGRTSNAFKVTMKLQTFLFQMVVTSCISVKYLWKYGFVKSSDNLYAPCIYVIMAVDKRLFSVTDLKMTMFGRNM